jgi:hypothetical protein
MLFKRVTPSCECASVGDSEPATTGLERGISGRLTDNDGQGGAVQAYRRGSAVIQKARGKGPSQPGRMSEGLR